MFLYKRAVTTERVTTVAGDPSHALEKADAHNSRRSSAPISSAYWIHMVQFGPHSKAFTHVCMEDLRSGTARYNKKCCLKRNIEEPCIAFLGHEEVAVHVEQHASQQIIHHWHVRVALSIVKLKASTQACAQ